MITAKFGGTSLADAARFRHVAEIIRSDPRRNYVVVSAPGKRFPADIKITDHLYKFQATRNPADFVPIEERFLALVRELELDLDLSADFEEMKTLPHNADYMASCGEYLSARIMAAYLGWPFVDTEFCVFFDERGRLDEERTDNALREKLKDLPRAVLPGYYGAMPNGEVRTFSRGGSDISGALVARAMGSEVYENWTDVDGILVTDPRIVPQADPIRTITYDELRELAYQGATVLHEDAVLPVRNRNIPIHICNTFDPDAPGSWIVDSAEASPRPVTGIAGRKNYTTIQITREKVRNMNIFVTKILNVLEQYHVPFEHLATGLGSICLVVPESGIVDCVWELKEELKQVVKADSVEITSGLAMIAVVGRGMIDRPGIAARLFAAVGEVGISVRVIDQGSSELNIVIGVAEADYEAAICQIYRHFFG